MSADPGDHGPEISAIRQAAVRLFTEHYADSIRALILTGSLARNEGTFVSAGGKSVLIGDAEFVVVLRDDVGLPSEAITADLCRRVETALLQTGLTARISAAVVHNDFLPRMKPHMFAYELRTCGVAIFGEPRILELVPPFAASEIPLEDAWWTLCNRSIEALEAIALADTDQPRVPRDVFYRVIKLYLDIATSLLLFTGGYEPSYAKRSQRLSWLATQRTGGADIPLPLVDFSREVVACTNWKLAPDDAFERQASWRWCFQALEYAGLLWRWELLRLTRAADTSDNEQLMASWMDMQPLPDRLRGWLYVWRGCGWLRSSPHWLHWTRLARRGSPRYWIYSAVGEILPNAVEGASSSQALLQRWRKRLPLVMPAAPEDSVTAWRQLTKDMAWNYHKFLEHTRA